MLRRPPPFYQNPRFLFGLGALTLFGLLLVLYLDDLQALWRPFEQALAAPGEGLYLGPDFWNAIVSFAFALAAPFVAYDLFYRLISQFVLPVSTPEERRQAMEHFLRYSAGLPGPLVFVQDGVMVEDARRDTGARTAGVAWVNSASCVVLRTDTAFTRVRGPGVVFMRPGEYLPKDNVLDLRLQARTAEGVAALTRDGIPVTVDITVAFILDGGEPLALRDWQDPTRPPYGFSPHSAAAAIYGQPYRDRTRGLWAELPALVAADLWREALMEREFESLFGYTGASLPLLDGVRYQVEKRLTGGAGPEPEREQRLLAERGLRVVRVRFANLKLPDEVRKKRLANWREDWKSRAGELAAEKDPEIKQVRLEGQDAGRVQVLGAVARPLAERRRAGLRPGRRETAVLATEAARHLAQDPSLAGVASLAEVRRQLDDLLVWVKGWPEA